MPVDNWLVTRVKLPYSGCSVFLIQVLVLYFHIERDNSGEADQSDIGHWFGSSKIAFSAYLSRTKNLGRGQHIKFDRLLMNDGDGYEASTGVFR